MSNVQSIMHLHRVHGTHCIPRRIAVGGLQCSMEREKKKQRAEQAMIYNQIIQKQTNFRVFKSRGSHIQHNGKTKGHDNQ